MIPSENGAFIEVGICARYLADVGKILGAISNGVKLQLRLVVNEEEGSVSFDDTAPVMFSATSADRGKALCVVMPVRL